MIKETKYQIFLQQLPHEWLSEFQTVDDIKERWPSRKGLIQQNRNANRIQKLVWHKKLLQLKTERSSSEEVYRNKMVQCYHR